MAEVFRAESAGLEGFKKKVAIKRVLPHLSEKKRFIQMFLDEARLGAFLSHSNCVQVFDVGVGDNTYFIVMEYVDGADLKAVIEWLRKAGRSIPTSAAVYITTKICEGLEYAHNLTDEQGNSLGLVHRDLSPPNVLITKFGEVKIVDFGLAKASSQLEKSEPGIIKGKFSYLSPEAALGKEVDPRTDIFAAGIILWELLAGRKLFQGDTDFETVKQVQRAEVPSISKINRDVDAKLEAIINKSLARDPDTRFLTAKDFAQALNAWLFATRAPISAFEVAELVQSVVRDKSKDKKETNSNVIDKLIDQTLFEFSSLDADEPDEKKRKSTSGNKGLDAGGGAFVDIQDWGSELSDLGGGVVGGGGGSSIPARQAAHSINIHEGNLAALEEDPSRPLSSRPAPAPSDPPPPLVSIPAPAPVHVPATGTAPLPLATSPANDKKGSSGLIIGVVLALAVLGAAGAYFGGLIKF